MLITDGRLAIIGFYLILIRLKIKLLFSRYSIASKFIGKTFRWVQRINTSFFTIDGCGGSLRCLHFLVKIRGLLIQGGGRQKSLSLGKILQLIGQKQS